MIWKKDLSQVEQETVDNVRSSKIPVTSQDQKFLDEFLAVIEKNLTDPDFDIKAVCKKLLISRTTLFRKIPDLTGEAPNEFIQSYRLERGAQLLRENYGNVTEVAEAVGFSDQFYFSKCFKKKFRQSPKDYQLYHMNKPAGESIIKERLKARSGKKSPVPQPQVISPIAIYDRELIARGTQMLATQNFFSNVMEGTPQSREIFKQVMEYYDLNSALSEALQHYETPELTQKIRQLIDDAKRDDRRKDEFYSDERLDLFDISNGRVHRNALSTAAVCMSLDLLPCGSSYFQLKVKNYGQTFKLHESELFYNQPIAAGPMCTGVLVGEDVIATAAHFANERNVTGLCFVFDFVMMDPITPVEQIPADNIYKGVEILERVHNPEGDWTLVKLDRKVTGREVAVLSRRDIFTGQPVYMVGHPCGLPSKYAPGASVGEISGSYFLADLDVYSGNSGSPVFCAETHELIGIVSRGKAADFRWTEDGWITLRYPKTGPGYKGSQCSRILEYGKFAVK